MAGATFGWVSYLQGVAAAPIETLAAIQYLTTADWAKPLVSADSSLLSWPLGVLVAVALLAVFTVINMVGIRWLARVNSAVTVWKIAVPLFTVAVLFMGHFHTENFTPFFTEGPTVKNILMTLPAGVIFSYTGFEQAVQLGGEAKDPQKDLALAVIGSLIIGAVIYVLVQIAFIGAMEPSLLAEAGGWAGLSPETQNGTLKELNDGPFFALASLAGLGWLAALLRADAVISPAGNALIYQTTGSRLGFGLARNGFLPDAFERVSPRTKIPTFAVVTTSALGVLFLLPFPSWYALVNLVTSAVVLMYVPAPLALAALRRQKPDLPLPYRLPWAGVLAPASFVAATWMIVFAGYGTYTTLLASVVVGYVLFAATRMLHLNSRPLTIDWAAAPWIGAYFAGLLVISYFGSFGHGGILGGGGVFHNVLVGGDDALGLVGTLVASAAWALVIFFWAVRTRLPVEKVDRYISEVT